MLQAIKTTIDLTCTAIHYSLYISYTIGHFLINILSFFQKFLARLLNILVEFLSAVLESFAAFSQDLLQHLQTVLKTIYLVDVEVYLRELLNLVTVLSEAAVKGVLSVVTGIYTILLSPKYVFLFIVNMSWSLVLNVKQGVSDTSKFAVESVIFLLQQTRDWTISIVWCCINLPKNIYTFLKDVPIETIVCLAISCCLVYVIARFYIIIFSFLLQQLKKLFGSTCRVSRRLMRCMTLVERVEYRRLVAPSRRPQIRSKLYSSKSEEDYKNCIICQEHVKSVLLLPCRHLCVCTECIDTLQEYHNTCPICRSDIERTMTVFL